MTDVDGMKGMKKVFVSGCLNGPAIRFNRTSVDVESEIWDRWEAEGRLVSFCAELAVGFPVPRPPAEIVGGVRETFGVTLQPEPIFLGFPKGWSLSSPPGRSDSGPTRWRR